MVLKLRTLYPLFIFVTTFVHATQAKGTMSASVLGRGPRAAGRPTTRHTAYDEVARLQRRRGVQASNLARNRGVGHAHSGERRAVVQSRATTKPSMGSTTLSDWYQNFLDTQYYVNVSVGTPPQTLPVLLDTGSSDFWLGTAGSKGLPLVFYPNSSSTYVKNGTPAHITYDDGTSFRGVVGNDVVTIAGMTVEDAVVELGNADSAVLGHENVSGIIGMAWSSLSSTGQPTFVQQLVQNKQLDQNLFSLYLSRGVDSLPPEEAEWNGTIPSGGSLTIGGIDNSTYSGEINFYPNLDPSFWAVQAEGMTLGGALVSGTADLTAVFDSGTTLILLPSDVYKAINHALNASVDRSQGVSVIDCAHGLPDVALRLGGVDYAIAMEDLVTTATPVNSHPLASQTGLRVGALACYLPFSEDDCSTIDDSTECFSTFGDAFLKSWVSVYDYGNSSVGLAASSPPSRFASASDVINFKLQQMGPISNAAKTQAGSMTLFSVPCILFWAAALIILLDSV